MKNSIYGIIILALSLTSCSSQKKLVAEAPFVLGTATVQEWLGGKEESGSGQTIQIEVTQMNGEGVVMQNLYFRGRMTPVHMELKEGVMYAMCELKTSSMENKPDMVMHADSTKEVGNQPPKLSKKDKNAFPFELKADEAVLSFMEDEKVKYYKVTGIKEKKALTYPGKSKD